MNPTSINKAIEPTEKMAPYSWTLEELKSLERDHGYIQVIARRGDPDHVLILDWRWWTQLQVVWLAVEEDIMLPRVVGEQCDADCATRPDLRSKQPTAFLGWPKTNDGPPHRILELLSRLKGESNSRGRD